MYGLDLSVGRIGEVNQMLHRTVHLSLLLVGEGAERILNFFVDNLENMSPKTAEAVMLQLNWLNLQEGCRYNNLILKGFSTMHDKMNVRPLIRVENGDYVIDKYVENEIGKVETGATGITINKTNKI